MFEKVYIIACLGVRAVLLLLLTQAEVSGWMTTTTVL
jgi:hypothetical protein